MKSFFYTCCLLTLITAGNMALAHGNEGGLSTSQSKTPAYKFNISPPLHEPPARQEPPKMALFIDEQTIRLSLTEQDGTPIDTEFIDAKAFIITKGRISTINLWPAGGNILSGKGDLISEPSMRVDIKLRLPGREPIRQKFYPFQ